MGLYGIYTQVDNATLAELRSLPRLEAEDRVFDLGEQPGVQELDIGTAWDGVHFLLTGTRALGARRTEDPLSEAVTGATCLWERAVRTVCFTDQERLQSIAAALDSVDVTARAALLTPARMRKGEVYPVAGWSDQGMTDAIPHFTAECARLIGFYRSAANARMNVLVELG